MGKKVIQLYLDGADANWVLDSEKIDDNLVIFGFEEHKSDDEIEQVFKTEQVLDKKDLELIKVLIDSILSEMP